MATSWNRLVLCHSYHGNKLKWLVFCHSYHGNKLEWLIFCQLPWQQAGVTYLLPQLPWQQAGSDSSCAAVTTATSWSDSSSATVTTATSWNRLVLCRSYHGNKLKWLVFCQLPWQQAGCDSSCATVTKTSWMWLVLCHSYQDKLNVTRLVPVTMAISSTINSTVCHVYSIVSLESPIWICTGW
jgi:hypothetical protein